MGQEHNLREHEFENLQLLKLGGSLITDKAQPHTAHPDVMRRLAREISVVLQEAPSLQLVLGHGSGSFGHVVGQRYGTRKGVRTTEEWQGFQEVWWEARALNLIFMEILHEAGLPALIFSPSAGAMADDGQVVDWTLAPIRNALKAGLLPVVYGDVAFDRTRGGTILSTEDLFDYLARQLRPRRILLAGLEPGVWADYPERKRIIPEITSANIAEVLPAVKEADAVDVTGGMASKVSQSLELVAAIARLDVLIFSGAESGALKRALRGEQVGTVIKGAPRKLF